MIVLLCLGDGPCPIGVENSGKLPLYKSHFVVDVMLPATSCKTGPGRIALCFVFRISEDSKVIIYFVLIAVICSATFVGSLSTGTPNVPSLFCKVLNILWRFVWPEAAGEVGKLTTATPAAP